MREWTKSPTESQNFAFLLFPRFSNHCLANAVEPLRAANEMLGRAFYTWRFVTIDGQRVDSSSGLPIVPHMSLRLHRGGSALVVVSSYDAPKHASVDVARALRAADARFAEIFGMDTGAWLLARAGLLDGRRATIHPLEFTSFSEAFPEVGAVQDRFVFESRIATCGGAMTSFELMLERLRRTHGEAMKLDIASYFMEPARSLTSHDHHAATPATPLSHCLARMMENIETPLSIAQLARTIGVSQKTLARVFAKELGATPSAVYRRMRLSAVRDLLQQSGYSISEIALRCGYMNSASMTRAFFQEFGKTPSQHRDKYRSG